MIEFTNEAELVDWLNSRDPRDVICFRTREALRTLPDLGSRDWSNHTPEEAAKGSQKHLIPIRTLALPVMRAILIGAVGSLGSTTELRELASDAGILSGLDAHEFSERFFYAAEVAQHAAFLVATGTAPRPAVRAFSTFLGLSQSTEEALHVSSIDADKIENAEFISEVFDMSLWPENGMPPKLAVNLKGLRDFFKSDPKVWGFWERWYDGFLSGNPIEWEVQLAIAELPNDDWGKGPEWIAEKIRRIERSARTSVAPPLILDQAKRVFVIADEDTLPSEVMTFARERIAMALQKALSASSGNGLHDGSYETITIRSALERHPGDASLLATAFYDASLSFASNIGETYPQDTSLINLKNALYATAEEICELSPEARKRCARLASLALSGSTVPLDPPDVLELADIITAETDEEAREVIQADAREIAAGGVIPKWLRARFTNYVTTVAIWIDRAKKGHERLSWLIKAVDQLLDWFKSEDK